MQSLPQKSNKFDRLDVSLEELLHQFPYEKKNSDKDPLSLGERKFLRIYRCGLIPLGTRNQLWHLLHRSGLDWNWLERFRPYWSKILGARALWGPQDIYFLRNLYRCRFQDMDAGKLDSTDAHLEAWQNKHIVYLLLDLVYREGLANKTKILSLLKKYGRASRPRILEYGCATAPVVTSIYEFDHLENYDVSLMDISNICLHYAAYKFQGWKNVEVSALRKENDLQIDLSRCGTYDAIFCITVFEHLNQPLETMKRFHQILRPGGLLFFDYIASDATGLDTLQGKEQRKDVLRWAKENFELLEGEFDENESMELTLLRKR